MSRLTCIQCDFSIGFWPPISSLKAEWLEGKALGATVSARGKRGFCMDKDKFKTLLSGRSTGLPVLLLLIMVCLVVTPTLMAQDSHYWTNQFGNRARLLGGAIIGSVDDVSAVYYNPGALALVEDIKIAVAGRVIELQNVSIDGFESESLDTSDLRLDLAPALFAGEVRLDGMPKDRVAYSFLTRHSSKFRLRSRAQVPGVELGFENAEFVANDFHGELDLNEYWFGGTWSRRVSDKTGVGVSTYFAYRGHRVNLENSTQALSVDGRGGIAVLTDDFNYSHLRLLWKAGVSTKWEQWQVGLTLTTPSIGIWGSGKRALDNSIVTQFSDSGGQPITEINTFFQETGASYRNPFSVGIGAGRQFGPTRLHLAGEFFAPIDDYTIIDSDPFEGQTSGETIDTAVTQDLRSIFNVAVGIEHQLKESLGIYGAFNTDFNATDRDGSDEVSMGEFDLYHVSGGVSLNVKGSDFTFGGSYAFSTKETLETGLPLLPEELRLSYGRFSFIVGFDFKFD